MYAAQHLRPPQTTPNLPLIIADAVIGKWHLAQPLDPNHPPDHGADYYMGLLGPEPGANTEFTS